MYICNFPGKAEIFEVFQVMGQYLQYSIPILVLGVILLSLVLLQGNTNAEILIQDVLWSKEYDIGLQENYFGMCTYVPTPCGTGPTDITGVCLPQGRCHSQGGSIDGTCRDGVAGECCRFVDKCEYGRTFVDASQLVTIIEQPDSNATLPCTIRIPREPKMCQIRVDFNEVSLSQANDDGHCETDRIRIKNSVTVANDFTTCGNLNDQHMYLTFGSDGNMIEIIPTIRSESSRYRITITKIPCNSPRRAPDYCLQYFTESSGQVKSFDYGGQQQSSQQYSICVKPTDHSSEIQWKPCDASSFGIVTNPMPTAHPCNTDWVQMKGQGRACEPFAMMTSSWKPYDMIVSFDAMELPPAPPGFNMPTPPKGCNPTSCPATGGSGGYSCGCVDNEDDDDQTCQCTISGDSSYLPDFSNAGFCLDFVQI